MCGGEAQKGTGGENGSSFKESLSDFSPAGENNLCNEKLTLLTSVTCFLLMT